MNHLLNPELIWQSNQVSASPPLVSFIVTSYDNARAGDLDDLFNSIRMQDSLDNVELIVVVERSRSIFEAVVGLLKGAPRLASSVFYFPKLNGMSGARNFGATMSRAEYVAFIDDDAVLDEGWLRNFRLAVGRNKVLAVTGPSYSKWIGSKVDWFPIELSWLIGSTEWFNCNQVVETRNTWGHNMAVRREEFLAVNGFSEQFGLHSASRSRWFDPPSEDVDLSLRLAEQFKRPILFIPGLSVHHKVRPEKVSLAFVAQRSYSTGYQRRAIKSRHFGLNRSNQASLRPEIRLLPRILKLLPESLANLPKTPEKSMNVVTVATISLVFSMLGYLDFRSY